LIALVPFLFLTINPESIRWSNYLTTVIPKQVTFSEQFAAILLAVMWAYNGWHDIAPVAEEVRNPQRNIPLALIGGTLILILLYVGANIAYHGVLTMEQIAGAERRTAQLTIYTTLRPLGEYWAQFGSNAITAVTMCSVFGALNCNLMLGPRIAFAMARDGIFWRPLAHVHPRFRTPAVSILAQACMSCGLVIVGTYLLTNVESLKKVDLFNLFTDFVVYSANIFYALCVLGVYILRVRYPDWERPYRTWGYPVVPALYLAGMGWFLWVAYFSAPLPSTIAVILVLVGFPVYLAIRLINRVRGIA
jgi:basic amino acid/polyamine antiporter, APA family